MGSHPIRPTFVSQLGFGLVDALVAVVLLSAGMLALLQAFNRAQATTREHLHAMTATAFMQDISERMHINRLANGQSVSALYLKTWDRAPAAGTDCVAQACNASAWANADLQAWTAQVAQITDGHSAIVRTGIHSSMLAILVGWRAPSSTHALGGWSTGVADLACPPDWHCHLGHVFP